MAEAPTLASRDVGCGDFTVPRPRLIALIDQGRHHPLTVITGPAGSGKTVLAESWVALRRREVPVAWLTLDTGDNQEGIFVRRVLDALRGLGIEPARAGSPLLPGTVERSFLEDVGARLGELEHPVVLVLDQLERITDERVQRQLDLFLDAARPGITVIATARREPRALTHRRRLSGHMTVIRAADLAFTHDETVELLQRHGLHLSDEATESLEEVAQGWAAGLRLCALAMREHGDQAAPTGGPWAERSLAGYLVDEVLDALPGNTRQLLVLMCVVDQVEPGLARALAGRSDADQVLRELAGDDVFVTTGAAPERWYRIHPLLLEVLRAELRACGGPAVTEQHVRAARWYDRRRDHARAAEHWVAAGRWHESCASVVRNFGVIELLEDRAPRGLEEAMAQVPPGLDTAEARVVRAAADLGSHRLDQAAAGLATLDHLDLAHPRDGALRASVGLTRLVLARAVGDLRAAVDAWRLLDPALVMVATPPARAQARGLALAALSDTQLWAGDQQGFERTIGAAAEATAADGCEYARISVRGQQALASWHRGALRDAARLGEEALRLGRDHGLPASHRTGVGHLVMGAVALEWNDRLGSRRHLEHADLTEEVQDEPVLGAAVKLIRAYHHALDGRRALAHATIADVRASASSQVLPPWMVHRVVVTDAMVRLRCGDADGARAVLEAAVSPQGDWLLASAAVAHALGDDVRALALLLPLTTGAVPVVEGADVYALVLAARIRLGEGDVPAARHAVFEALRIARPEGRRRPFVEARRWLAPLIADAVELVRASSWIGAGLAPGPRTSDDVVPVLVEPLTARETAVLALMAQVMTVADIAEDLYISVNTVKTHQKSVYRKLSVARAQDAVRRGRDLELI